jgi:hypothetical protein
MSWKSKILVVSGVFAVGASLLAPPSAQADQCWAVTADQADRAATMLRKHRDVRSFCAPCRDQAATSLSVAKAEHVKRREHHVVAATDAEGKVHELDLAYTYVRLKPGVDEFTNMASLVGCPASGVPERINGAGAAIK